MTFEEKVKFLRTLPTYKVIPISEVKAVAFATRESETKTENGLSISLPDGKYLILSSEDIKKIVRVYPDLEDKLLSE